MKGNNDVWSWGRWSARGIAGAGAAGWLLIGALGAARAAEPELPSTAEGDWPSYTGDVRGTRYSPLDQIDAGNFEDLEQAWSFKTDNLGSRPEYQLEGTPLAVNGTLYVTAGTRRAAIALDGATGELIWMHSEREGTRGDPQIGTSGR
jgi:quinoprotein glucose dehydrogenase